MEDYLSTPTGSDGKQYLSAKSGAGSSNKYLNAEGGGSIASTYLKTPTGNDAHLYLSAASAKNQQYGKMARKMRGTNYGASETV